MTTTAGDRRSLLAGATIVSTALVNFEFAIDDAERLVKLHDSETKRRRGPPSRQVEVFKRAAIILSITAWESFVEDTIRACAEEKIRAAASPADLERTFNSVAQAWLQQSPKAPDLARWAGDGWKSLVREKFDSDLRKLNTANSKNVRDLSKCYLNTDITAYWSWARTRASRAAERLDELINLRGDLVHRGPEIFRGASVRRKQAADAVQLLKKLVQRTEKALGTGPRSVTV